MRRVAYLTGRAYKGVAAPKGTLPALEQPTYALIAAAARARDIALEIAYWDDETLPQRGFDGALIRSCWDYHQRYDEFVTRIDAHARAGLRVFNSADVIRWNSRKTYLKELGASAIETVWAERADAASVRAAFEQLGADEIVVKPQIGAGSIETIRLKRDTWNEGDLRAGPKGPAMIQAFLKSIVSEGEHSLFWFGGAYSHAIRKAPKAGDWRANIPGETLFLAEAPPKAAREAAEQARAMAPKDFLYVRIDLVLGDDGGWRVIEVEAIEPHLFLDLAPAGAEVFAGALSRVLSL